MTSARRCHRGSEKAVTFAKDAPVYTCIRPDAANGIAHSASRDRRGSVRRMSGPGKCGRDVQVVLPARGPRSFCVDSPSRFLRNLMGGTPCHAKGEFKVILAKRRFTHDKPAPAPAPQPKPADPQPAPSHAPVAADDTAATDEDHGTSIAAIANDADADGDAIRVSSLQTTGIKGTAHIAADGTIAYDPHGAFDSLGAGQLGHDSFTYRAADASSESAPATVSVTVSGVNDLPVAAADSAATGEDATRVVDVLSNDTDADGDALHVASVDTTATTGAVTVNPDGTVTYDPDGQFDGLAASEQATDSFTYRAADGHGDSGSATVFVTVTGANDAPALTGIEAGTLAYDTGAAATEITGSLAVSDADDANLEGATATIASGYESAHDELAFIDQNGISGDWDGTTGVLTLSGTATVAQYEAALRSITFHATDPAPSGSRTIDFEVSDGDAGGNSASRTIAVTHVNHAPVAVGDAAATDAATAKTIAVLDNDSDSDEDVLDVASLDTTGTAGTVTDNGDGTIEYDPNGQFDDLAAGAEAHDSFTYKANDGTADSAAATVDVTVTGVNDAPVLSAIEPGALAYDTGSGPAAITGTLAVADADDANTAGAVVTIGSGYDSGHDTLSFSAQNGITGSWDSATGALTLSGSATKAQYETAVRSVSYEASAPTASGSRRIDFVVDDGHAAAHASNVQSRTITLTHVNHDPVAADDSGSASEDAPSDIAVLANDTDADLDTIGVASVDTTGTTGTATINPNGTIAYDPNGQFESLAAGAEAHDSFTYKANDGTADSAAATVDVTVTGVNDAPALGSLESPALSYDTGSGPAALTTALTVSDVDTANLNWAQVSIGTGHSPGHDALTFTAQAGISGAFDDTTGSLTLTGSASVADYQAVLRSVRFATDATTDSGSRVVSFQVDDGETLSHASALASRGITIQHVNHAPTAAADSDATDEDSAIASVSVLGNDSDVDGDSPLHVSGVDASGTTGDVSLVSGTIAYSPAGHFDSLAAGATTTDSFKYTAADPGDADSAPATVTVTITGVDDAPALTQPDGALAYSSDQAATALVPNLDATDVDSANLMGATIQIGSGYVSGKDVLSFTAASGITGVFDAGTATLTLSGTATKAAYQAALRTVKFAGDNASGVTLASRTVSLQVNDGTLTSALAFRTVDVTHVNQAPQASDDSIAGAVGNTTLAVSTSPAGPHTTVSGNVLANDTDADNAHSGLTATAVSPTSNGAKVSMNTDGTFTYVPPQGFTGDDTFTYTVHDNDVDPKTATGTVTVSVAGPAIWYVDAAAAAGGDGRSDAPFQTLAPLSTGGSADAKDASGDRIFVYRSATPYGGGIVLEGSQQLIGQSQGLTTGATTLVAAAGANAVISGGAAPAVTLGSGSSVKGIDASAASAPAIAGTGVTTATVDSTNAITGTGGGVMLDGGSGNVTIDAPITTTGGHSVDVKNRTGGTVALTGAVGDTGTGIQLRTNTGATITFTGAITASTGTSSAFSAASGGTVSATATTSTLATTTGTALDVRSDTIGSAGLKFQSVSANGAANGIVLDTTGAAGGLSVTGTGTANSGGTIQSTTGHAISLKNTTGVSLKYLNVSNPLHAGVKGANVHGFSLTNSTISGAGGARSDTTDSSLAFNDTSGGSDDNVDGVLTVTGNTLSGAYGGGVDVAGYAGTISNAVVTNNTISSSSDPTLSKGSGISFRLLGTASTVASLAKATITSNTITNFPSGDGISVAGGNTSSAGAPAGVYGTPSGSTPGSGNAVDISSNRITGDPANKINGAGIAASVTGRGVGNFAIDDNGTVAQPLTNMKAEGIATGAAGDATANFQVKNNVVVANNVLGSAGMSLGTDKNVQADTSTLATPVVNALLSNNSISGSSGPGMRILTRDTNGTTNLRIAGNTIGSPAQGGTAGLRVDDGSSGNAAYNPTLCADINGNTAGTGPADGFGDTASGILLFKRSALANTYAFGLTGLSPSPAAKAQAESYLAGVNPASSLGGGFYAGKRVSVNAGDQFVSCALPF